MPNLKISQFTNLASGAQGTSLIVPLADTNTTNYGMTLNALFSDLAVNTADRGIGMTGVATGSAPSVSAAGTSKQYYNTTLSKQMLSRGGAAYEPLVTSAAALTATRIPFSTTNGILTDSAFFRYSEDAATPETFQAVLQASAAGRKVLTVRGAASQTATVIEIYGDNSDSNKATAFFSSGNVGIGILTENTVFKLDVRGRIAASSQYALNVAFSTSRLNSGGIAALGASDSTTPDLIFYNHTPTERMRLSNAGALTVTGAVSPSVAGASTAGTALLPFSSAYIGNAATNNIRLTGTATAARTATFPDASGTVQYTTTANTVIPTSTFAGLPAAPTQTLLYSLTDNNRGLWAYNLQAAQWVSLGRQVFDVRDFGASPSASAPTNVTAINAAITAANAITGGAVVALYGGTFSVNATITLLSNVWLIGNGTIQAAAAANYDNVINANAASNVRVQGITVDANGTNRAAATVATAGIRFATCTNCHVDGVTVTGTLGSPGGSPGVGIASVESSAIFLSNNYLYSLGTALRPSDGYYCSGASVQISNSTVKDATDTSFVLEGCTYSRITDCISDGTPSGGAITNFLATDAVGNSIDGLTIKNWNAATTGGLAIGTVGSQAGELLDTNISNVVMVATRPTYGNGPAIRVNNGSSDAGAAVRRVTISNVRVYDASTQGIAVTVTGAGIAPIDIRVQGGEVNIPSGGTIGILAAAGSAVEINGTIITGCQFGLATTGASAMLAQSVTINSPTSWAAYAFDTSNLSVLNSSLVSGGVGLIGKDGGATNADILNSIINATTFVTTGNTSVFNLLANSVRIANAQSYNALTSGGTPVGLVKLTADANNITRFKAGVDAGGFQWSDQAETVAWSSLTASRFSTVAATVTSASATAFVAGANGATNPVLKINAATASVATGLEITGAAAGGGVALAAISSGTNESLSLSGKGTGRVIVPNGTSTAPAFTMADGGTGLYRPAADGLGFVLGGTATVVWSSSYQRLTNTVVFGWSSGSADSTAIDAGLYRNGAGAIEFNRGTAGANLGALVTAVASGANYASLTSAVTTASPAIAAAGSDSNISLQLSPKGTGIIFIGDTGTATATAGAATLNTQRGTITSESLTTAAGAAYTLTITNNKISASSIVLVDVFNDTNTVANINVSRVTPGSGSVAISVRNASGAALDGTIKINFIVL